MSDYILGAQKATNSWNDSGMFIKAKLRNILKCLFNQAIVNNTQA